MRSLFYCIWLLRIGIFSLYAATSVEGTVNELEQTKLSYGGTVEVREIDLNRYELWDPCYGHFDNYAEYEKAHLIVKTGRNDDFYCLHLVLQVNASEITNFNEAENYCAVKYNGHLLAARSLKEVLFFSEQYMRHYFPTSESFFVLGINGSLKLEETFTDGTNASFLLEPELKIDDRSNGTEDLCLILEFWPKRLGRDRSVLAQVRCTPGLFSSFVCKEGIPASEVLEPLHFEEDHDNWPVFSTGGVFLKRLKEAWILVFHALGIILIMWILIVSCPFTVTRKKKRSSPHYGTVERSVQHVRFDNTIREMQTMLALRESEETRKHPMVYTFASPTRPISSKQIEELDRAETDEPEEMKIFARNGKFYKDATQQTIEDYYSYDENRSTYYNYSKGSNDEEDEYNGSSTTAKEKIKFFDDFIDV